MADEIVRRPYDFILIEVAQLDECGICINDVAPRNRHVVAHDEFFKVRLPLPDQKSDSILIYMANPIYSRMEATNSIPPGFFVTSLCTIARCNVAGNDSVSSCLFQNRYPEAARAFTRRNSIFRDQPNFRSVTDRSWTRHEQMSYTPQVSLACKPSMTRTKHGTHSCMPHTRAAPPLVKKVPTILR